MHTHYAWSFHKHDDTQFATMQEISSFQPLITAVRVAILHNREATNEIQRLNNRIRFWLDPWLCLLRITEQPIHLVAR